MRGVRMRLTQELQKVRAMGYFRDMEDKETYYLVTCPFHGGGNERTPSMSVNKERFKSRDGNYIDEGYIHCFGCGYKGRFTKFLADLQGVSEFDILKQQQKDKIFEDKRNLNLSITRGKTVTEFKFNPLPLTDRGRKYLHGRKLTDEVIERFNIVSNKYGNVVFPLIDKSGNIIGEQARDIDKKFFNNTKDLDKKNFLYGLYQLKGESYTPGDKLYVTESIIDTLTLWSWGFKAVALMGAKFSEYHLRELIKLPYDIVLSLDNDEVGKKAMSEVSKVFIKYGKKITLLKWGNTIEKDINDLNKEKFLKIKER